MSNNTRSLPVSIGIDETSSETRKIVGFTYFCLPDAYLDDFIAESKAILQNSKLVAFHGKEYKKKHRELYLQFLKLIKTYAAKSLQAKALLLLLSNKYYDHAYNDLDGLIRKSLGPTGIDPDDASTMIKPYLFPLVLFARSSNHLGDSILASYHFDRHNSYVDLKTCPDSDTSPLTTGRLVEIMYNKIVQKKYSKSPSLFSNGIQVVSHHEQSFLIQAADVLGNFSLADMFVQQGIKTTGRIAKSDILQEVFGDIIDKQNFGSLQAIGEDLTLSDEDAQISFELKWHETK